MLSNDARHFVGKLQGACAELGGEEGQDGAAAAVSCVPVDAGAWMNLLGSAVEYAVNMMVAPSAVKLAHDASTQTAASSGGTSSQSPPLAWS